MSFKNKKFRNIFALILLVLFFVFIPGHIVFAGDENSIARFLSLVVLGFADAFGYILTFILGILSYVFTWQDFNNPSVTMGWTTVRDLCNMAFILMLLVIAFSTILRYENYNWKKTLPKLLMMAVLINFSKTITLLLIDFSQVIMLTFANAFAGTPGNFVDALGLQYLKSIDASKITSVNNVTDWHIFYAAVLALVVIIISIIIMVMMTAMLIMRMVMLWILIVLSPLAFLDYAISNKYFSQWASELTKYLTAGPVLAFFVWLALSILGQTKDIMETMTAGVTKLNTATTFGSWDVVISFVLAIGLLVGAMKITAASGAMGGNIGMNMANSLKSKGLGMLKAGGKKALKIGREVGSGLLDEASLRAHMGDLNLARGYGRLKAQWAKNKESRVSKVEDQMTRDIDGGGVIKSNIAMALTGNLGWEQLKKFLLLPQKEKKDAKGNVIQPAREWGGKGVISRAVLGGKAYNEQLEKRGDEITAKKRNKERYISGGEYRLKSARFKVLGKEAVINGSKILQKKVQIRDKENIIRAGLPEEQEEKEKVRLSNFRSELATLESKRTEIGDEMSDVKKRMKNPKKITDKEMKKKEDEINNLEKSKKDFVSLNSVPELVGLSAAASAKVESEGKKEIEHVDNSEALGVMFEAAIRNQKMGLATAIAKKMAKAGNYNELQKQLGLGTGLKGMHGLGKKLESAGMSQQAAFSVLADIGETCKNLGQFGAFATVTMENGKFREATDDEHEASKYAEMSKMQPQEFARKVNRLGLGAYEPVNPGDAHSLDNWKMSRATAAYIKDNGNSLGKQYRDTGQLNAIQHLAHEVEMLRKNGVTETDDKENVMHVIITRGGESQSGPMQKVKGIKK